MAFNKPFMIPGRHNPAIGPLQPEFATAMETTGRGKAKINMRYNENSKSNTETQTQPKRSGKRVGGKTGYKGRRDNGRPVVPFQRVNEEFTNQKQLRLKESDFSYSINGSTSPNNYVDTRDNTLFRDWNLQSKIEGDKDSLRMSNITNAIRLFDISPEYSLTRAGYSASWNVILDMIRRDIIASTNGVEPALKKVGDITHYLHTIAQGFAMLMELEGRMSWNPTDNAHKDTTLRHVATKMSDTKALKLRTALREVLYPHILPIGWMDYIKWMYQPHLSNHQPESTKQLFMSSKFARGLLWIISENTYSFLEADVQELIDNINRETSEEGKPAPINRLVASTLTNNVSCVKFGNVNDHFDGMFDSSTYDAEWNNIFNNRVDNYQSNSGGTAERYPKISNGEYYIATDTLNPYSMVLAGATNQASDQNLRCGLPLESDQASINVGGNDDYFNRFYINEDPRGTFKLNAVNHCYEDTTNSVHRVYPGDGVENYSGPVGINVLGMYSGDSNGQMAARQSLNNLTLD
jgi:hypothetical protein